VTQAATTRHESGYWAGYRFTPRLIAATESAVWVVESHLPVLVRIDPRPGSVAAPRSVGPGDPTGRGAHDLLAWGESLWIRWNDGITRLEGDSERWVELSAAGLATGDAGVWALTGDGRLARIDPDGAGFETLGRPEVRRHSIAVGHGAVWTLTWTHVPGASTLARIDPDTGHVEAQLSVQGSPRQLLVDRDGVYVRVWRRDARGNLAELLLSVEPDTVRAAGELLLSPPGSGGAVRDGVAWAPDVDPYAHDERGEPSSVRRIDLASGDLLGSLEVPGWVTAIVPGPEGVWGCLERRGVPGGMVVELTADGVRTFDLSGVDIAGYLPRD
jgi:hypothetical protein